MKLLKIIQKLLVILLSVLLFAILAGILVILLNKALNIYTFSKVKSISSIEFSKIQLENELEEEREQKFWGPSCDYDYKVRATRCNTNHDMYFISDSSMISEFQRVDEYLRSLGWTPAYTKDNTPEALEKTVKKGLALSEIYRKKNVYNLDLHLIFYRQLEVECEFMCSDKLKRILTEHKTPDNSVYSIKLTTDMIDR